MYTYTSNGAVLLHHCFSYQFDVWQHYNKYIDCVCTHTHTHTHTHPHIHLPQPMFQLARDNKDQSLVSGASKHVVYPIWIIWYENFSVDKLFCCCCRNERDTAMAHMVKRLTNEGSTFLGEKIIEVRRVGPPQEVWYKLGESLTWYHNYYSR